MNPNELSTFNKRPIIIGYDQSNLIEQYAEDFMMLFEWFED